MSSHPYRAQTREDAPPSSEDASWCASAEEKLIAAILISVGGLGVIVGFTAPSRTVEPALGLLMLFFVARWRLGAKRSRHR